MRTSVSIRVLERSEMEKIDACAFKILDETGVAFEDGRALKIFEKRDFSISGNRVYFDEENVREFVKAYKKKTGPLEIRRETRLPEDLKFGIGNTDPYVFDWRTHTRRPGTLKDQVEASIVADALENVVEISPVTQPWEYPPDLRVLHAYLATIKNAGKKANSGEILNSWIAKWFLKIGRFLAGSEEEFKKKPFFTVTTYCSSPLTYSANSVDKILFCFENDMPIYVGTMPMLGATAPVTISAGISQILAEVFAAGIFCSLLNEEYRDDRRWSVGGGPAQMDLRTGHDVYGSPDRVLAQLAMKQMSEDFYGISWSGLTGLATEAKVPDVQCGLEKALTGFMQLVSTGRLAGTIGELDTCYMFSLEQLVIDQELVERFLRICRGVDVEDEALDLKSLEEGFAKRSFIGTRHTVKHYRKELFIPKLSTRDWWDNWAKVLAIPKRKGIPVMFNSDGNILEIIPDLIEIGVNILDPIQPKASSPQRVKDDLGDRLALHGLIDIQEVLPFYSSAGASGAVRKLISETAAD